MKVLSKISIVVLGLGLIFSQYSCNKDTEKPGIGVKDGFDYSNSPGDNAQDYVADRVFETISVQILHMPGAKPTNGSLNNLESFLNQFLNKSKVELIVTEIASGKQSDYSIEDIRALEKKNRTVFNGASKISASMLFVDGEFSGNSGNGKVLGVAYNNTSMAIFEKTLQDNAGGLFQPSLTTVETTVMNHEFGHLMGLVNNGAPLTSAHHDSDRGAHCTETDCLMYYAVEGSDFITNLSGGNIPVLDDQCKADLNALR